MSGEPRGASLWPYYAAIFLAPLLVLWRQDNTLFTSPGLVDSWMYLGFFESLRNFKRDLFPNTYYGSRLPWLLAGQFFYSAFSPAIAGALLHLSVFWAAAASLFTVLQATIGARAGLLATLIFAANPQVWSAIGSDYVDGAGIACFLLALALLTLEARSSTMGWRLLLAGGTVAALVYINLFWTSLVPMLALHYLVLGKMSRGEGIVRMAARAAAWCGIGFALVTVFCGVLNLQLDGLFWFFVPSIHIANSAMKDNPWYRSPWTNAGLVPWLWVTVLAGVSAMVSLAMLWRRPQEKAELIRGLFAVELAYALCLFLYLQFVRHVAVLAWPYYASSLLPFTFLVIGATYFRGVEQVSKKTFVLISGAAAVFAALTWADFDQRVLPVWPQAIFAAVSVGGGLLVSAAFLRNRTVALLCALAGFAVLNAECRFVPDFQIPKNQVGLALKDPHGNRAELERVLWIRGRVETIRRGRPVDFWYDNQDPAVEDYRALNSTYLNAYSLLSTSFPELPCQVPLESESIVVVLSARKDAATVASAALPGCIGNRDLTAAMVSQFDVPSPFGAYGVAILQIAPDPARWHRLTPSAKLTAFASGRSDWALENWRALDPAHGDSLRRRADTLIVRTTPKPHTDAATYGPISVPASGHYEFTLRYADVTGKVVFGAVTEDGGTWLCADDHGHYRHGEYERNCSTELRAGERIMMRLSNGRSDEGVSSITVTGLSAVEQDAAAVRK